MILIKIGSYVGFWTTLGILIIMGLIGFLMVRSQGFAVVHRIKQDIAAGIPPTQPLLEGLYVFAGGLLLITPGLITDAAGLLLLFPPTRMLIDKYLTPWIINKVLYSKRWYIRKW